MKTREISRIKRQTGNKKKRETKQMKYNEAKKNIVKNDDKEENKDIEKQRREF